MTETIVIPDVTVSFRSMQLHMDLVVSMPRAECGHREPLAAAKKAEKGKHQKYTRHKHDHITDHQRNGRPNLWSQSCVIRPLAFEPYGGATKATLQTINQATDMYTDNHLNTDLDATSRACFKAKHRFIIATLLSADWHRPDDSQHSARQGYRQTINTVQLYWRCESCVPVGRWLPGPSESPFQSATNTRNSHASCSYGCQEKEDSSALGDRQRRRFLRSAAARGGGD